MTTRQYDDLTHRLRQYFRGQLGYVEVPAQSRLSILAACEDPRTIAQFVFDGVNYPLPQTGQMVLERNLLEDKSLPGVFCATTSYRNEPFPIPGRHDKVFPMFEWEGRGGVEELVEVERGLLKHLGFQGPWQTLTYERACEVCNTKTIEAVDEEHLGGLYGPVVFLTRFPQHTSPFWNMKSRGDGTFEKVDVLLGNPMMETVGSAERSCNPDEMRASFMSISDGQYAGLLFSQFGRDRVLAELEAYLALDMVPRFGAGIGMGRLERAMGLAGLL
jgi:hypothetical protein